MTTLITPIDPAGSPPPEPPILYGFRDVITDRPDGTRYVTRIPLTLEDCLHPEEGDVILTSSLHEVICDYLADVFRWKTAADPTALVLSNTGVYWDKVHLGHHAPDVCVIFGIRQKKANYTRFNVVDEKTRPSLIVEVVSPNTRKNDVEDKMVQYHEAGVPFYVILDREKEEQSWQLRGYQWTPAHFSEMPKVERSRLWLEAVGIWLEVEGLNVRCRDRATDRLIGDYTQTRQELLEQMAQVDLEKANADQEKQRADQEKQRADSADEARLATEARMREMEAELTRLRNLGKS